MSYEVLARKWRPKNFDDVVSQSHVTTPLRNAILSDRVPHAILLTGPRGVGKTTLARIMARCLNCDEGPTDKPCGQCSACEEISAGRSTDVQEIDAASRTSVDDVREIIESVRYAASGGKHRIYVIDEVHMLSTAAFNALLKTLEEPPPRSLFVLATTNPEKIPYTVVSRCQRYDLRQVPTSEITSRLAEVAASEAVKLSDTSLQAVARAAAGSLRDGLTLLDQLLASGESEVSDERVAEVLDLVDREVPLAVVEACIDGDAAAALAACRRADEAGIDPRRLSAEILQVLRDLVVLRVAPGESSLIDASEADLARLREAADREDPLRLRRMFRALVREQEDLAYAPDAFSVVEMAVVRLASLPAGDDVEALLTKLAALEAEGGSGGGSPSSGGGGRSRSGGGRKSRKRSESVDDRDEFPRHAAPPPVDTAARNDTPQIEAPPYVEAVPAIDGEVPELGQVFDRLRAFAEERNRGLFAGLSGGTLREQSDGWLRISLPEGIAASRIQARKADLEAICSQFFSRPTEVEFEIESAGGIVRESNGEAVGEHQRESRKAALRHEAINEALEIFQAEIVEIRPLGDPVPGALLDVSDATPLEEA